MAAITTFLRFLVRGGPTAKAAADTPLARELLLDTTTQELRVGDGATPGGLPLTVGTPNALRHIANKGYVDTGLASRAPLVDGRVPWANLPSMVTGYTVVGAVTTISMPDGLTASTTAAVTTLHL